MIVNYVPTLSVFICLNFAITQWQADYLKKISIKLLTMETKHPMPNAMASNSANIGQNPPDPGNITTL